MKKLFCLIAFLLCLTTFAANTEPKPIPVDEAFTLSAQLFSGDTIVLHWQIAPQHYLYQDRFHFKVVTPAHADIGTILYPAGQLKHDELLGNYQAYAQQVDISVPIRNVDPQNTALQVQYQGCTETGYCYPPTTRLITANFYQNTLTITDPEISDSIIASPIASLTHPSNSQTQPFLDTLTHQHFFGLLLAFLGFGLLLSFTPCVLPMLPILSGIIMGHQKTALRGKTFRLSLVYVLSMAVTYAVAGMLVGWLGGSVQTLFQKSWVIVLFSLLFVLLALSFFGLYTLKLPESFENHISQLSRHQKSGHYLGVAIMGCLATLIVSPCVTPALVGVLGYISQTGNAWIGGAALFAMGLGMGAPLLALGLAGGKLLPKAGGWMQTLEHLFGVLFLAMAIWMLDRVIPGTISLMLWSILFVICAVYLGALSTTPENSWGKLRKGIGVVLLIYGFLLAVGAAQGNSDPLRPLNFQALTTLSVQQNNLSAGKADNLFKPVKNLAELQNALAEAAKQNKPVLLDFYADWCTSCHMMENTVFKDPAVLTQLNNFVVLKADITANNAADKKLMQHFEVIAPPTFLIFDAQGQQITALTRVGEMDAQAFLAYLKEILYGFIEFNIY